MSFATQLKVWWHDATLFVYFSYFTMYIHSFNHILTTHLSVAIRWGLSPFLHRFEAQWESLPVVPSRESNSGLPYSKPTPHHTQYGAAFATQLQEFLTNCLWLQWDNLAFFLLGL
jgi:hypothetical protein